MPVLLDDVDFSDILRKPSSNKQAAKKFMAKYPKKYFVDGLEFPESFKLVSQSKGKKIRLVDVRDRTEPRIIYAVDIEVSDKKVGNKSCTQVMVWAHPANEDLFVGIAKKVFRHLLNEYIIVVSDDEQTFDGKRFWERRISDAFSDGNHVYYIDHGAITKIDSADDFFETYEPLGWGRDKEHLGKLFAISKDEI